MDINDEILKAYSLISSLKGNIPDSSVINDRWVKEYHIAVEKLEKSTGKDLSDFKVPSTDLKKSVAYGNYITKEVKYRDGLWCERNILIQKVDAILIYFTGLQKSEERKIGFNA